MEQTVRASIEVAADCAALVKHLQHELLRESNTFSIRLPLSEFSIPGKLEISKDVTLNARLIQYSANMPDDLHIEFAPAPPSQLFPTFRGVLSVRDAQAEGRSILVLTGSYQTPLGAVGEMIDLAVGHRIAERSAEYLLAEIASRYAGEPAPR